MPKQTTKTDVQIALLREINHKLDILISNKQIIHEKSKEKLKLTNLAEKNRPTYVDYVAYTDGGCSFNPGGKGGYGAIIIENKEKGKMQQLSGGYRSTTNNRMEIKAAIEALKETPKGSSVEIVSDSEYLIRTMLGEYQIKKNLDMWEELDVLIGERTVYVKWVKGHSGDPMNDACDELASEAQKGELLDDVGYIN